MPLFFEYTAHMKEIRPFLILFAFIVMMLAVLFQPAFAAVAEV